MKRNDIRFIMSFLFVIQVTCISCNSDRKSFPHWHGGLIKKFGVYTMFNNSISLEIKNENGLLDYKVFNQKREILIKNQENISIYSSWSLYWDTSKEQLWISSGDIGVFVWVKDNSTSSFKKIKLNDTACELCSQLPKIFYENLPKVLKKYYHPET